MKKHCTVTTLLLLIYSLTASAQYTRYIIKLKDKGNNSFSLATPAAFLSQIAIERRTRYNIPIDSTDLPVTARYLDSIRLSGAVEILNTSKWLNQVAIRTTDTATLDKINKFSFVESTRAIASFIGNHVIPVIKKLDGPGIARGAGTGIQQFTEGTGYYNYGKSNAQVKIHHGDFLHDHGFRGEGMKMVVLDGGFFHYKSLPTFDSIRLNNQILGTWDFVANEQSVDEDDAHGMECLSTIAANLPGTFIGTAPKTAFYLYRTEDVASEYPIEEQNWAAGLEKADSLGVPVSSTSLGYYTFDNPALNYTYADMNGNTTISARAADMAAKKGMLLVIAAGNEGNSAWHYIITPSDADSVLAVGAVDTLGRVASFSSYGPSSDGQVKPGVASVGLNAYVASPSNGQPITASGTSFACPNMAGLVTCLWQAFPEFNNMSIIDAVEKSATRATVPDNRVGYGIPDMKKAFVLLIRKAFTKQIDITGCVAAIQFSVKATNGATIELERKSANDISYNSVRSFENTGAFSKMDFTYSDDLSAVSAGPISYRLKMKIDSDTTFYLDSSLVNFTPGCTPTGNLVTVGPNPVSNQLLIKVIRVSSALVGIEILNAMGQKVFNKTYTQQPGTMTESVPMAVRSKGVYFVLVFIDGKKTFMKQVIR